MSFDASISTLTKWRCALPATGCTQESGKDKPPVVRPASSRYVIACTVGNSWVHMWYCATVTVSASETGAYVSPRTAMDMAKRASRIAVVVKVSPQ